MLRPWFPDYSAKSIAEDVKKAGDDALPPKDCEAEGMPDDPINQASDSGERGTNHRQSSSSRCAVFDLVLWAHGSLSLLAS